ncbi:methionyl-tRNA formyltransferase [Desulfocapsa sulfexigens DSM 10523]|uniref:Methionyl-tRNA formyltransferase n=1 Tax=Desulfocapsa sulfexigens (strain DSM 10523 / SB164P1) TaxID=1167006 RepID=M1P1L9_DESSD|nr:methionyl-tRNA formyltransferase [Desulfocapsa sulfexigens]AGF77398.1 methionyl-tRNA formyltransferase [Desulfocapsa sulfexigens DSM 10523]
MPETDKTFRIIFMGTPDFSVPALQGLIDGPDQVVAVITQPDRPKGRGKKLTPPPVKVLAQSAAIPVLQPTKIKTAAFADELRAFNPDLIIVAAYGRILPSSILNLPPLGCINIHGSLLPRHRGAAPIQWAILAGDKEAGVTIMEMDEGMDTGAMLLPASVPVSINETAGGLFTKLSELGGTTLLKALDLLRQDKLPPIEQEHSLATEAPPLKKEYGAIDWNKSAWEIHCLIRGMDPWPTAYSFLDGTRFRFFAPELTDRSCTQTPGSIIQADRNGLLLATGDGALLIHEIQPEGKKRMSVEAYLCGHLLETGQTFRSEQ